MYITNIYMFEYANQYPGLELYIMSLCHLRLKVHTRKGCQNVQEECKSFYLLSTALTMTYTVYNCKLLMEKK